MGSSPERGYQDRRMRMSVLIVFVGIALTLSTMRRDGLRGIIGVALGTLLAVGGTIGVLWRMGHLMDAGGTTDDIKR
jgi:hypothetical protein